MLQSDPQAAVIRAFYLISKCSCRQKSTLPVQERRLYSFSADVSHTFFCPWEIPLHFAYISTKRYSVNRASETAPARPRQGPRQQFGLWRGPWRDCRRGGAVSNTIFGCAIAVSAILATITTHFYYYN